MPIQIKTCPFCGCQPEGSQLFQNYNREKWAAVECPQCSARGPEVRTSYDISARWGPKAIEEWNERA